MQAPNTEPVYEYGYIRIKQCKHGPMMYNTNDRVIGRNLDLYGEWGEPELQLLEMFLTMGDVVLDIGANIGTHTIFFAQQVAPSGFVWAFEPQRLAFQMLCGNVALNGLPNVYAHQLALGDKRGTITVPTLDPRTAYNFGGLRLGSAETGEQVGLLTVDELDLSKCSLIKIDVEGFEEKVLHGAMQTIRKFQPVLFVENHTIPESGTIIRFVQEQGYRCWWQLQGYSPDNFFQSKEDISNGYIEANMLCLPGSVDETDYDLADLIPVLGPEDNWKKALERR